ncbi:hypothetical protein VMCG_08295 [Cytospora schulzeri]|uniref:HTH APSES-type domain-containing protein n=1 Tax=Cytospora schulzeri TaxID=448051 RepID=A0A423VVI3_9PEZI|nr:hypothetical protein VMCG_08295 [Valsa malicola]
MRPKDLESKSSDEHSNTLVRTSSAISLPSSPSRVSLTDDSDVSSDSDESLETPQSSRYTRQGQLSYGTPCKDQANSHEYMLCQTDGASDDKRSLPVMYNPLLANSVPHYVQIVSSRRLRRLQLDTGALDFAYLVVPLPEGIVSAVFNRSPRSYPLLRRSSDGYLSAMAMFKAAFPGATAQEVEAEREYIKSNPTSKRGVNDDNFWIHPTFALELAEEYRLLPYVQALLDPADITIQEATSDGSFQQIKAPPRYSPPAVATPPATTVSVPDAVLNSPGDGSPIGPDGKPATRLFDHRLSLRHRAILPHQLVVFNDVKRVLHLQVINPVTKTLETDPRSLVITIDGVIYTRGESHKQGGAIVFFHHACPWNTLAYLQEWDPHTKEQAILESLYQALTMIKSLVAADPVLREVRIMTSSRELCALYGLGMSQVVEEDAAVTGQWLKQTDMRYWSIIDQHWRDLTDGKAGRPVDVRLWLVGEQQIQPATEVAIAEMYRGDGRDWYEENGKGHDLLKPNQDDMNEVADPNNNNNNNNYFATTIDTAVENQVHDFLDQMAFVPPHAIVDQGSEAVAKWANETRAMYKQFLLYLEVAARGLETVTNSAWKDPGRKRSHKGHWEAHSRAISLARGLNSAALYFDRFMATHPVVRRAGNVEDEEDSAVINMDAAGDDLVQTVVEMFMTDKILDQVGDEMEWE